MTEPLLRIEGLRAAYGECPVLEDLAFSVAPGETVALLGRNGAGKTTTLRALVGLVPHRSGQIRLDGADLMPLPPHHLARCGIGYVPEERGVYASLTVAENLALPRGRGNGMPMERILALFPNLAERWDSAGTDLSGGEQQMLAIARVLRMGIRLLVLDEPTEGLAPAIVQRIGAVLQDLRRDGMTILLVEQNFRFARRVADRFLLMEHGRITANLTKAELPEHENRLSERLGV
ncbi:ABC transporter ATP-binding protein [Szabonella alba]|uniref:ABC transporter ATP-binding protein n=1 Tax=Szabonella alba TaxID=2804194 RepID=A0A8K0VHB6_9RHOB|nr:ABC transporter ATP-binding protein [Szabonella alba]MBL4919135.1 ABC transporter ATP-binding protein [Szabonella alba]